VGDESGAADSDEERKRRGAEGPPEEDVEDQAANEGEDDPAVDPGCDGPDDGGDEDRVYVRISNREMGAERCFQERGDGRSDRSKGAGS